MNIQKDTIVTIRYRVSDAQGKLIDEAKEPTSYLHGGYGNTLAKIEAALEGQQAGYQTTLQLQPADAFGERESDSIAPGHEVPPLVDIDGWKFGVMTCYDIRFPELARRHAVAGADALVVSAAWARGEGKVDHWTTLCKARALENTCYLMACSEHSGHDIGHSMVVDPAARILAQSGERDELIYADLNRDRLEDVRRILPVLKNRRITL